MYYFLNKVKNVLKNKGMTYVELIVVLSIMAVLMGVFLFNYKNYQAKIDMKVLANDVALKITEAQKLALSGNIPVSPATLPSWKPSYGIFFPPVSPEDKIFYFFVDLDEKEEQGKNSFSGGNSSYEEDCVHMGDECLDVFKINKGNVINKISRFNLNGEEFALDKGLNIVFRRPESRAIFTDKDGYSIEPPGEPIDYVKIEIFNEISNETSSINIYPSGRIQIN